MKDRRSYCFVEAGKYTSKLRSEWLNYNIAQIPINKGKDANIVVYLKKNEIMSKGNDSEVKSDKKSPAKSLKEKRTAKAAKREEKKSE